MSAEFFARGYSDFLSYLAEPAVRSLVIGCIAAAVLAAFRVKRVAARLLVWTGVLCAALTMPLLGAFLPRVQVGVPAAPLMHSLRTSFEGRPARALRNDAAASSAIVRSAATAARIDSKALVVSSSAMDRSLRRAMNIDARGQKARAKAIETAVWSATPLRELVSAGAIGASAPAVTIPVPALSSAPTKSFVIPWTALLLSIYLAGVAILFARLLIGVWFSRRLARAARNVDDREAMRVLRFRSCIAGLANAPLLKESGMLAVPATVGVRRAVILLPVNWRAWTDEQLDAILAHEISHVARRDALVQVLSLIHRAVFWFSPLPWWLDKQLTDLAEQVSDEAALAGGADRTRYAEALLGFFAQLGATPGRVWWQGVSMAKAVKAGSAERRVDRILAWRGVMSMKKSFAVALIAAAAPIVFLAASVHPFIARAQDKPPAPPQNVVQDVAPVVPPLPKALKGGVVAPATPAAPAALAPAQGVVNLVVCTVPAQCPAPPAPSALAPIGGGPVAPAALAGPVVGIPRQPATAPAASTDVTPTMPITPTTPTTAITPVSPRAPMAPLAPTAPVASQNGESHMEMTIRNGWTSLSVKVDGAIEFTDDDSDVKSLSPNGHFRLEDGTWLSGRAYDVKADAAGNLTKTYSVDGTTKPLDADGHEWLARVLPQVIRESGIGAAARVARILREGGPQAVLTEIGLIHSDGSKRIYLEQLFSQTTLNPTQLKSAASLIRGISSDGDKAQVLITVDKHYLTGELRPTLFDVAGSISSDGDKRIVLSDIIQKDPANVDTLVGAAVVAKHISSDGDKAELLIEIGDFYRASDQLRAAYFDDADSIASDGDHARVLMKLLTAHGSDRDTMVRVLRSDERISSDGDKAAVLEEAVAQYSDDTVVQGAFFDAANSIASDGDHQQVLVALVHCQGISSATLGEIANSAERISSDGDKARVLVELAAANVEPVRDAFFAATDSIASDGDRGRVLIAILDKPGTSSAMAIAAIHSATGMSSDGDKGRVLLDAADRYPKDPGVNAALRNAVSSLHSDSEYRAVMSEIARRDGSS